MSRGADPQPRAGQSLDAAAVAAGLLSVFVAVEVDSLLFVADAVSDDVEEPRLSVR